MNVTLNDFNLPVGVPHYFNGVQIKRIYFNGVQVYEYDNVAPVITVVTSAKTADSTYTITGTVNDTESGVASVTVGGEAVTVTNGSFSKVVSLNLGANSFVVAATDAAGNTSRKTVSIKRLTTATQSAPLSICTCTYRNASSSSGDSPSYEAYITKMHSWKRFSGSGFSVRSQAWYNGRLNLMALPDWEKIRHITIQYARYAEDGRDGGLYEWRDVTTTYAIAENTPTFDFQDYKNEVQDTNGVGVGSTVHSYAWAGVRKISYSYI